MRARNMEQVMDAKAKADYVRLSRADLKREIKAGRVLVVNVLRDPPDYVENMRAYDLIAAQHRWGAGRVHRLFVMCDILETKTVGSMTERQIGVLIDALFQKNLHSVTQYTEAERLEYQ